mgnify:FL=1
MCGAPSPAPPAPPAPLPPEPETPKAPKGSSRRRRAADSATRSRQSTSGAIQAQGSSTVGGGVGTLLNQAGAVGAPSGKTLLGV